MLKKEGYKKKEFVVKIILILSIIFLSFISCKKEKNMTQDRGLLKNGVFSQAHIYFKDTVVINKWYKGKVFYKSLLDTLKLTKKDDRFITLFVNAGSVITQSRDIKKIPHDSLSSDNDTIYFKVIFKELGNNYLNAHMKDEVYMESSQAKDEVRHIVKFSSFDMPVYVIENSEK